MGRLPSGHTSFFVGDRVPAVGLRVGGRSTGLNVPGVGFLVGKGVGNGTEVGTAVGGRFVGLNVGIEVGSGVAGRLVGFTGRVVGGCVSWLPVDDGMFEGWIVVESGVGSNVPGSDPVGVGSSV